MNEAANILLEGIHQRMMEMGYCREDYRLRPFVVNMSIPTRFSAFNEFWYLFSTSVPAGTSIESDSEYFSTADAADYKQFNVYGCKEFTGNIIVRYTGPAMYFEFIRVTIIKTEQPCPR